MNDESRNSEAQRLAERYRSMSDMELSMLAADAADLTETAHQALSNELSRRGVDATPPVHGVTHEEEDDHRPPVIIAQFQNLHEALLAKGQLDSAGIPCSLVDDNMVRMDWFISNLLGGVKLTVKAGDETAAREVLSQPIPDNFEVEGVGEYVQPRCPKCASAGISFESLDKVYAYGSMMVLGVPIPVRAERWRCHDCGAVWEGTEDDSTPTDSEGV